MTDTELEALLRDTEGHTEGPWEFGEFGVVRAGPAREYTHGRDAARAEVKP